MLCMLFDWLQFNFRKYGRKNVMKNENERRWKAQQEERKREIESSNQKWMGMRQVPSGNTNNLVKSSVNFQARHFLIYVMSRMCVCVCVCENERMNGKYGIPNSIDNYDEEMHDHKLNSLTTIEKNEWKKKNEMVTCFRGSTTAPYTHALYAKQFVTVYVWERKSENV